MKEAVNSGLMYEIFGKYTPNPPEFTPSQELLAQAARKAPTALWVLGRKSGGEECDRHLESDFILSAQETALLESICAHFEKVVVVLNTNGLLDPVLGGGASPGKVPGVSGHPRGRGACRFGRAAHRRDQPLGQAQCDHCQERGRLPCMEDFSWDKDHPESIRTYGDYGLTPPAGEFARRPVTAYREDLYLGYRYFDSFGVEPLYPFGFGLSYTSFTVEPAGVEKTAQGLVVKARVKNTGGCPGREVAQVYVSAQGTAQQHPAQELKAFCKTRSWPPGRRASLPDRALEGVGNLWGGHCSMGDRGRCIPGKAGNLLCRNPDRGGRPGEGGHPGAAGGKPLAHGPGLSGETRAPFPGACPGGAAPGLPGVPLSSEEVVPVQVPAVPGVDCSALSDRQLACLCVGYGPGQPFVWLMDIPGDPTLYDEDKPLTENDHPVGINGYVSPAIPERGIHSVFYKDGPAGVGATSWPGEMLLACSFDEEACTGWVTPLVKSVRKARWMCGWHRR